MAWRIVPALEELRLQLNAICPDRDKTSDGGIGDYAHSQGKSSHNPDDTSQANAEWNSDSDAIQEVRARDFDVDLRHPGLDAQDIVNHLVKGAKAGKFWWLRYIIYNKKIWHKNNGWNSSSYDGANSHTHHFHVNTDFNQNADTVSGVNYELEDLVALTDVEIKKIAKAVWDHEEPNPYDNGLTTRRMGGDQRLQEFRADARLLSTNNRVDAVLSALASIAQRVDLEPNEIQSIKDALAIPTPQENADAVVEALGTMDLANLAQVLRNGLSQEQLQELASLLITNN